MGFIAAIIGGVLGFLCGMLAIIIPRNAHKLGQYRHTRGFNEQQKMQQDALKADQELLRNSRRDYSEEHYGR